MSRFFIFVFSILFACGISKSDINKIESKEILISLERKACYGTCPIYKMIIYDDGSAIYSGKKFVENIGLYKFTVTQEKIKYILAKAKEINFFEMRDEYTEAISDLPKTITFIKNGRNQKKVIDYYGAPKTLKDFENLVDSCIDYKKMKKIEKD